MWNLTFDLTLFFFSLQFTNLKLYILIFFDIMKIVGGVSTMKKNKVITNILNLGMILLYVTVGILGIPELSDGDQASQLIMGYYVIGILFMFIIIVYNLDTIKKDLKDYFHNFKKNIWYTFKYLFIGMLLFFVCRYITYLIANIIPPGNDLITTAFISFPLYVVFVTIIYTPFVEEVVFRKLLSNLISNKYLFIVLSASIFSFFHIVGDFSNVMQFISLFFPIACFGAVLAYSYRKTNNIFIPIFIHLLYNSFVFITLLK